MDGLSIFAVCAELQCLVGGKVAKIQQPERETLLFTMRAGGSNERLLLCAHPQNTRVQLTDAVFTNPSDAPMFCMLLRKHVGNAVVQSIEQINLDRVLRITFLAKDELGDPATLSLMIEMMGKHSNIIFVNEKGTILECARHVTASMSSMRIVLPGAVYEPPPSQDKINPFEAGEEAFREAISGTGSVHKLLAGRFFGLSIDCARQMVAKWAGENEIQAQSLQEAERGALARFLFRFYAALREGHVQPTLVLNDTKSPVSLYPFEPSFPERYLKPMPSMSVALDALYSERDHMESLRRRSASLNRILQNHLERCYKKLAVFEQALQSEEDLEELRLYGELLSAQAYAMQRGLQSAKLINYYLDPPAECLIPLDEKISPQENAQRYFKRYQKGKAAKQLAAEQKRQTESEIAYLEGQLNNLAQCSADVELAEIREEMIREGYIRPEAGKQKRQKTLASQPLHVYSSDGCDIYIGKNNQQNDALTLHFAKGNDYWLHTKNIPGSHVLIRPKEEAVSEQALREAAMLAAYFSKARASSSVPVDYCLRKYVKKPAGARPGMVIYTNQRTLFATPEEMLVKQILEQGVKGAANK